MIPFYFCFSLVSFYILWYSSHSENTENNIGNTYVPTTDIQPMLTSWHIYSISFCLLMCKSLRYNVKHLVHLLHRSPFLPGDSHCSESFPFIPPPPPPAFFFFLLCISKVFCIFSVYSLFLPIFSPWYAKWFLVFLLNQTKILALPFLSHPTNLNDKYFSFIFFHPYIGYSSIL